MIGSRQIADLGVARLGLPIPMAKLATIQSIASALCRESTSEAFVDALAGWLSSRELESECLEALCPLLVAQVGPNHVERLRQAISRPSISSDLILSLVVDNPELLPSWIGCHSGPVPNVLGLDKEVQELTSGEFIPPIFGNRLENLEERADRPFLLQWAFEYSVLRDRVASHNDGYLGHFLDSRQNHVGQFVTRKGHLARSAYLRTLACAADHWGMPPKIARSFARIALPADPIFLKIAPQEPPAWASSVHSRSATEISDFDSLVRSTIDQIECTRQQCVMHCSLAVIDIPLQHVELELFAVATTQDELDARNAVELYRQPHVEHAPVRDGLRALVPMKIEVNADNSVPFLPVVMPILGDNIGYLQFHFLQRRPYLPLSTSSLPGLKFVPGNDNFNLLSGEQEVGAWQWWLWNWSPGQPREWPSPIATCTCIEREAVKQIENDLCSRLDYVWRITAWNREREHDQWEKSTHYGHIRR